jgi:hypothetical protein
VESVLTLFRESKPSSKNSREHELVRIPDRACFHSGMLSISGDEAVAAPVPEG